MDIITGMDYQNGHYAVAFGALNVFYLYKMYLCSHMNLFQSFAKNLSFIFLEWFDQILCSMSLFVA